MKILFSHQPVVLQMLPDDFGGDEELDLSKNIKVLLFLSLSSVGVFIGMGGLFIGLLYWVRWDFSLSDAIYFQVPFDSATVIITLLAFVGVVLVMIFLHEAVHGIFIWLFTRHRPQFGFKGGYAYTAAPEWYFNKQSYLVVCIAPLVLITVVGFVASLFLPVNWVIPVLLLITLNASGAFGDMYVFFWVLAKPDNALVEDFGDRIIVYRPVAEADPGGKPQP